MPPTDTKYSVRAPICNKTAQPSEAAPYLSIDFLKTLTVKNTLLLKEKVLHVVLERQDGVKQTIKHFSIDKPDLISHQALSRPQLAEDISFSVAMPSVCN